MALNMQRAPAEEADGTAAAAGEGWHQAVGAGASKGEGGTSVASRLAWRMGLEQSMTLELAIHSYALFHQKSQVTEAEVVASSAGIDGWAAWYPQAIGVEVVQAEIAMDGMLKLFWNHSLRRGAWAILQNDKTAYCDAGSREGVLEVIAAIGDCRYPDELVQDRRGVENKVFLTLNTAELRFLPREVRNVVAGLYLQMGQMLQLPDGSDLQALVLLDIYLGRSTTEIFDDDDTLPAMCVSIMKLLSKVDSRTRIQTDCHVFLSAANWFSQWLHLAGHSRREQRGLAPREFTADDLRGQEQVFLQGVQWRIDQPTAHFWLGVFCERLNAATEGLFQATLDWILEQGASEARVAFQNFHVFELPQRRLALGLLCHGLVAARVLDAETLRPSTNDAWEPVFARDIEVSKSNRSRSAYMEWIQQSMFEILQIATDSDRDSLECAIDFASAVLRESAHEPQQ